MSETDVAIDLPYGHGTLPIRIPAHLLGEVVSPRPLAAAPDLEAEVRRALDNPVGSPGLEELARGKQRVAVIIDDITRETPTARMLPLVLERLHAAGVAPESIKIVLALGTHRPMTPEEIEIKAGRAVMDAYEIVNVSCWDESQFVHLGVSSNGIPAWVNRAVAEADLRIGLGGIGPHSDAGYSGGAKIILPGVCSGKTVDVFHTRCAAMPKNLLGSVDGPIRQDLERFVGERVGLDFILNAILTRDCELYQCVAGHFIAAHRAGIGSAQNVYGVPVERRYPLVISNAHPSILDLWQSSKGLWSGESMVAPGGALILVTPCPEGINVHPLYADYMRGDPDVLQAELDAGRVEDPNACAGAIQIGRMRRRIRFGLVSAGLSREDAARMGFTYYATVEEAVAAELGEHRNGPAVAVLTHSGLTLPLVREANAGAPEAA